MRYMPPNMFLPIVADSREVLPWWPARAMGPSVEAVFDSQLVKCKTRSVVRVLRWLENTGGEQRSSLAHLDASAGFGITLPYIKIIVDTFIPRVCAIPRNVCIRRFWGHIIHAPIILKVWYLEYFISIVQRHYRQPFSTYDAAQSISLPCPFG